MCWSHTTHDNTKQREGVMWEEARRWREWLTRYVLPSSGSRQRSVSTHPNQNRNTMVQRMISRDERIWWLYGSALLHPSANRAQDSCMIEWGVNSRRKDSNASPTCSCCRHHKGTAPTTGTCRTKETTTLSHQQETNLLILEDYQVISSIGTKEWS